MGYAVQDRHIQILRDVDDMILAKVYDPRTDQWNMYIRKSKS